MNLKEKIKNHDDFSLKFNDAPFKDNGILNPGWAEPTYDDFFERMVDVPVLLNQSTVLPMTALQHDLDMLTADVELDSQRDTQGCSTPLTETELEPGMERKQLIAQPLQAKTIVSDNFLEENIEGEDFSERMNKYFAQMSAADPKSRDMDDGWGYMVLDQKYEEEVVIPARNRTNHLSDIFNRLRIQRNNIAHSETRKVNELSPIELNECLDFVLPEGK